MNIPDPSTFHRNTPKTWLSEMKLTTMTVSDLRPDWHPRHQNAIQDDNSPISIAPRRRLSSENVTAVSVRSSTVTGAIRMPVLVLGILSCLITRAGAVEPLSDVRLHWLDSAPPKPSVGVTWGVPWAQGTRTRAQRMVVHTATGQAVQTQSWPLAFWPDGSVKWSGLAIAADASLTAPLTVHVDEAPAPGASTAMVMEDARSVLVTTGRLTCRVARSGSDLIESMHIDGREIASHGRLVAMREDRSRHDPEGILREEHALSRITLVTVEQSGPVRAVVRVEGMHQTTGAEQRSWLPFCVRLCFTAGVTSIRVVHSFVFDGDADRDFIRGLGLSFTVPFREERQNRHVRFACDDDGIWAEPVLMSPGYREALVTNALAMQRDQLAGRRIPNLDQLPSKTKAQFETIAVWDSFKLTQLAPDAFSIAKRTGPGGSWLRAGDGHRAGGLAFVGDVSGGLAIGMRRFWEKYPSGLEISGATSPAARLTAWFWSPDAPAMDLRHYDVIGHDGTISYEDHEPGSSTPYGVANTSELTLWTCAETPSNVALANMAEISSKPPLLVCSPQYYHDVPVFGVWSLPDRSNDERSAIENQLDRAWLFFANEVERRRWYGFWDYGDVMRTYDPVRHRWQYDIGGHAWNNTELMSDVWLWYAFLRSGRADAFRFAEATTRHTSEVDVYHLGRFAGIGSRHNVSHWGCGAKEVRISESFLKRFFYYLTADERTGDLMRETLTADEQLPNAAPLRKKLPRPDIPLVIRSGPDWTALASNWFTEWERTGDTRYRDQVLAGMQSLGAMPDAFAERSAFGFDLKSKTFTDIGEPNLKTSEFLVLFGGDQIMYDILLSIDCPPFSRAWHSVLGSWARKTPDTSYTGSRITAYMASVTKDPELGRKAWSQLRASLRVKGKDRFPAELTTISGPEVAVPATEGPQIDTPGTAQWALSLITGMEFVRDFYEAP